MASKTCATVSLPTLTQIGASIALKAAVFYASEIGVPMSVAVVDAHAQLLSFTRMDSAKLSSVETSISMAVTSASNRLCTSALSDQMLISSLPTTPLLKPTTHRLCTLPGGLPIISSTGVILGAIGCSIGDSMQDEAAAIVGRDAVLALIRCEAEDEERRIEEEREKVLKLWKEKEGEVESLKDELEMEREARGGSGKRRKTSSVGLGFGPDTPPEEGEVGAMLKPSFVGEARVDGF